MAVEFIVNLSKMINTSRGLMEAEVNHDIQSESEGKIDNEHDDNIDDKINHSQIIVGPG